MGCKLIGKKPFINFREYGEYTYRAVFFRNEGVIFLKIGVTCANLNLEWKVSLLSIVFAILHIGKVNDEVASLIIVGDIESTPVAFLG